MAKENMAQFIARQYKEKPERLFLVCALSVTLGYLFDDVLNDLFAGEGDLGWTTKFFPSLKEPDVTEAVKPHNPDIYRGR